MTRFRSGTKAKLSGVPVVVSTRYGNAQPHDEVPHAWTVRDEPQPERHSQSNNI
jgi:hypothetical protein